MSQKFVPVATPIGAATEAQNETATPPLPTAPSYVPTPAHGSHHADGIPVAIQNKRLENGLCPTCGGQVSEVMISFFGGRTLKPLTILGKVDRGCCLRCNPDNTAADTTAAGSNNATSPPATTTSAPSNHCSTPPPPVAASDPRQDNAAADTTAQNWPLTPPAAASIPRAPSNERRRVRKTFIDGGIFGIFGVKGECDGEVDDVGRRDGYGSIRYSDGDSFVGEWRNNTHEGHGEYTWADGNVYVGQWGNGKKEGRGKWTCHDGSEFDGNTYEGEYKDDKREGWGKYTSHKSGDVYEGEWKNNKREGRGTYTFASNGNVREGRWKNGVEHGVAIYRCKGGDVDDEVWDNGKLVSEKRR